MGRRAQLNPQSRIQRKSSSRNFPSSLYGKCCIQSLSVEKYSRRLKPYHFGLTVTAASPAAIAGIALESAPAAVNPAIDSSTLRREILFGTMETISCFIFPSNALHPESGLLPHAVRCCWLL